MLNGNNEIWKDMVGFEGRYQVSDLGRIRSILSNHGKYQEKIKAIRQRSTTCEYLYVQLSVLDKPHQEAVHRAVAKAFISNPDKKLTVNHIDGNKLNNIPSNLEWATYSENLKHAHATGLKKGQEHFKGVKVGSTSRFHNVGWDKNRNRFFASVKHNGKNIQKNFSVSKYGEEAELLAAQAVNKILDDLNILDRPRNVIP